MTEAEQPSLNPRPDDRAPLLQASCPACGTPMQPDDGQCPQCGRPRVGASGTPREARRLGMGQTWAGASQSPPVLPPPVTGQRRRRRRRRWTRRHPLLSALIVLLVIGVVSGGYLLTRATSTVSKLQSQSTPPPSISLQTEDEPAQNADVQAAGSTPEQASEGGQTANAVEIDTKPAQDALAAAGLGGNGSGGFLSSVQDRANTTAGLAQGAAAASGVDDVTLEPMTILLMGVDARPGEAIDVGVRPDALAVLRLDPTTGSCRMLAIPRDSRVDLPGYGMTKINHALAVGGIPYQQMVVEQMLALDVDRYALVDFGGIQQIVDAMGGVKITISDAFTMGKLTFEPGMRTLNGEEALAYARYRGGPDGDFGRIQRQQQVLRALLSQATSASPASLVRHVLPKLADHVRTDLTPVEMIALGTKFATTCTDETLETLRLDGSVATFDDPVFKMPLSYVVIDAAEVQRKVAELLRS